MKSIPVDVNPARLTLTAFAVEAKTAYGTEEQQKDKAGVPVWVITALAELPGRKPELVSIKVSAAAQPAIAPGTSIGCRDLFATRWENNGRSGVSLSCSEVVALPVNGGTK